MEKKAPRRFYLARRERRRVGHPSIAAGAPKVALSCCGVTLGGEPDAGNPHVRFDERMSQTPDRFHVTQDFILQNGPVFEAKNLKTCVNHVNLVAPTADTGNTWKKAFSLVMRGAEAALEQVGVESGVMKSLGGEPMTHILGETFYTQVPHLHGLHIPVSVDRSTSLGACQRVGNITIVSDGTTI